MKGFGVLLLVISFAAITFAKPLCKDNDTQKLWKDETDNTVYYQCIDVGRPVQLKCQGGYVFNEADQKCAPKKEDPANHEKPATPEGPVTPGGPATPGEPPYPTPKPDHPTPATEAPTAAPTPAPTGAPVPETTLPSNPPIDDSKK